MKRGRPNVRYNITSAIMDILGKTETPVTTSSLKKFLLEQLKQDFSWNTVQKYLNEMLQTNQITSIDLPHTKIPNKTGLTVYTLKK